MRKLLGLLLCIGLCTMLGLGSVGCSKKKEKEADKKGKTADGGAGGKDKKEELTLTIADVVIDKEKGTIKIAAVRKNFDGDVELEFGEVKGVEFKTVKIKKGEDSAEVGVTVDKEKAKAGEYDVTVKGKGGKAATHDAKFKLTIKGAAKETKKAKITLSVDDVAIKLDKDKKGKGTAKITATRENYDGAIEVKFGKTPKGVTIKDATIAKGKDSVDVDVVAADAAAGDAEVTVTGTGGEATADTKLKLSIAAK
jgi:hypothetical protein